MSFESFNLHPSIMSGVRELGYTIPTPIQEKAIPPVMQGKDIIGLAQTGTGKTAAFVLPILQRLINSKSGKVSALVISPTRELAEQTCEAFNDLGKRTRLRCVAIYGGMGMEQQKQKLRRGAEIVVACPGRLLDHIWQGTISLSGLEVLVIDEADRMFDMGFLPDIRNILKCIMHPRQTLLFSATMPADIRRLVQEVLHDPVTIQVGSTAPAITVSHALFPVRQHLKTALLKELLRKTNSDSVLIFTRTKHRAERVSEQLEQEGHRVTCLQGNLSQSQRQYAMDGFRSGRYKVLVATDVAARGIDVLSITHVINFDMPDSTDAYTHRIGRTGRVGKEGDAYTFVTGEDSDMVRSIENLLNKKLERRILPGFNYEAPDTTPKRPSRRRPGSDYRDRMRERRSAAIRL